MNVHQEINRDYALFFKDCAKFAVSPYAETFKYFAGCDDSYDSITNDSFYTAMAVIGLFTDVIPVLPLLLSITIILATVGFMLGALGFAVEHGINAISEANDYCTAMI